MTSWKSILSLSRDRDNSRSCIFLRVSLPGCQSVDIWPVLTSFYLILQMEAQRKAGMDNPLKPKSLWGFVCGKAWALGLGFSSPHHCSHPSLPHITPGMEGDETETPLSRVQAAKTAAKPPALYRQGIQSPGTPGVTDYISHRPQS